jgi:inhibitor of cysteine peptidase
MKKAVVIGLVALLILGAGVGLSAYFLLSGTSAKSPRTSLGRFESAAAFVQAYRKGLSYGRGGMEDGVIMKSAAPTGAAPQSAGAPNEAPAHSNTNVQVAGVDEADIVKNDGNYIYAISGNTVFLVAAYPAQQARIVSRIDFPQGGSLDEMFVSGNRLVVIGGDGYAQPEGGKSVVPRGGGAFIRVYDITDRARPALVRNVQYEGSYSTARLIGQDLHVVLTSTPYYALYDQKKIKASDIIPRVSDTTGAAPARFVPAVGYRDVQVVDPKQFTSFLSVVSLSLEGGNPVLDKRVVAGYSDNVFASTDNLYVASTEYQYYGMWPESNQQERTTVYKFKFKGPSTAFVASGEVPGTILNQFSMDEANGYFRIATTLGYVSREGSNATNNVYVLDPAMKISGRLEGLARGE